MGITAFPFSSVIDVPTARILGRDDAGTGSAEALTNTEIFAILGTGTPSASTYLRGDGTWSAVSTGISSLNGLTDATQTFAVGTSGTNVAFSSAAGVHTLNIPDASLSARGVITTGAQNIQGVKAFYSELQCPAVNLFSWWGMGDGANGGVQFFAGHGIAWGSAANGAPVRNSLSGDVQLRRDAAGRLGQRSGTTAQAFGLYNTFTSDTSFERLNLSWASNVCYIGTEKGSAGGTARDLTFGTDGAVRLVLPAATTSGALYLGPRADNTATGGNARGANAVDLQTVRTAATQVAAGTATALMATQSCTVASAATYSAVIASSSIALQTGAYCAVIASQDATVSPSSFGVMLGCYGTSLGTVNNSVVLASQYATASRSSQITFGSDRWTTTGDRQSFWLTGGIKTTTNAAVEINFGLGVGNAPVYITLAAGRQISGMLTVQGCKSDGTVSARYCRLVTIRRVSNTTTLDDSSTVGIDLANSTSLSVTADSTNHRLNVSPIGILGETWRWQADFHGIEQAYGT